MKNIYVVAVLLCIIIGAEAATATVVLRNASNRNVTVSSDPNEPTLGQMVASGATISLRSGSYYLSNIRIVQGTFEPDGKIFVIRNSVTEVGLVEAFITALGTGSVGPASDVAPITGDF